MYCKPTYFQEQFKKEICENKLQKNVHGLFDLLFLHHPVLQSAKIKHSKNVNKDKSAKIYSHKISWFTVFKGPTKNQMSDFISDWEEESEIIS